MKELLIEVKELTKSFNCSSLPALDNVNLHIYRQDIYGLIGTSGAGKSTLLRCLATLEAPSKGSIFFCGEEIGSIGGNHLRSIRQKIGMVFQHFHLFSSRTVFQNIAYPLEILDIPQDQQRNRIQELLSLVSLEGKGHHYPYQLSGGEKQRVAIARALAHHPLLLLCDEPTSALDPKTGHSVLQLLLDLNQKLGVTIILITHHLDVVKKICNRVGALSRGKLMIEGTLHEVLDRSGSLSSFYEEVSHAN